jgi:hypothetical protein
MQRELAYKQPTSITGVQLQEGADASAHRASAPSRSRSSAHLSTVTTSTDAAPRESALQHWLVPDNQQRYWAIWTSIFTLSACFIFAFMAGNFAVYQQSPTYAQYHKDSQMPVQVQWGPKSLEEWLKFWQTTPYNTFDVGYLMNWGARCGSSSGIQDAPRLIVPGCSCYLLAWLQAAMSVRHVH